MVKALFGKTCSRPVGATKLRLARSGASCLYRVMSLFYRDLAVYIFLLRHTQQLTVYNRQLPTFGLAVAFPSARPQLESDSTS